MKNVMTELGKMLAKQAEKDLALARKHGKLAVTGTRVGNIEIRYRKFATLGGQYMIVNFNNTNFAHAVGRKAEMVKFLVDNYEVIHE